ncbi:PREDICTED: polyadenylate-binding protein 4 [Camelina sativa]|uniref:Polyadenylate-binding protein 4 n=1 Tax=Camelina sativa TaxID=90675 RepID=A0ABM0Y3Y0_CAMSA|nr:PREDICTED: polyadenylate-binding protein 4 [Camelina sativa]
MKIKDADHCPYWHIAIDENRVRMSLLSPASQPYDDKHESIRSVLAKDFRGESRGFAFIEFQTEDSAGRAMVHFNGRLIGQKILDVERTLTVEEGRGI